MRIRKRPVQQPFSSISPLISSDPNLNRSPVVQHPPRRQSHPPTDHPTHPIRRQKPIHDRDSSTFPETTTIRATHGKEMKKIEDDLDSKQRAEERGENGEEKKKSTCTTSVFVEELAGTGSTSHQGEKAFPLKKRLVQKGNDKSGKKRGRNGALMEGSRCSRVNGRGWRCCQLTLVGYSLCEHHLGKGRLRSITGAKSRSNDNLSEKEDRNPPLMKLGMVKARSMSSLLGQNDDVISVPDQDN